MTDFIDKLRTIVGERGLHYASLRSASVGMTRALR